MGKYIDVDKLIAKIKRFSATEYGDNTFGDDIANGALDYVLEEIIPSLQQEQPEVDLEKEIKRYTEEKYHETFGNGQGTIDEFDWEDIAVTIEETAVHFAEWEVIHLNARKEEQK